jgi:hypothetical protein
MSKIPKTALSERWRPATLPESKPVTARQLELSSLGAWLDLDGDWNPPPPLTVECWRHRATMGRDQKVVVVERGNLYPIGNRASLVTVSSRVFVRQVGTDARIALLLQQEFVVVRERIRSFAGLSQRDRRAIPFRQIEIVTSTSPPIDSHEPEPAFWPQSGGRDVEFELIGTDHDDVRSAFSMPLLFVAHGFNQQNTITQRYASGPASRRKAALNKKVIAFAPPKTDGSTKVDAALATETLEFRGVFGADGDHPFHPALATAAVRIRELDVLTGGGPAATVQYNKNVFLKFGFDSAKNKGEVFVELTGTPPTMAIRADQGGGVGAPSQQIAGLSRSLGPVGGLGGVSDVAVM